MKRPSPRLLLTHAATLLAGLLLAATAPGLMTTLGLRGAANSQALTPAGESGSLSAKTATRDLSASRPATSNAGFRQAWDLLMTRPMKQVDRYALQAKFLAEWADTDLPAAIRFATSQGPAAYQLSLVFSRHPLESWKFLASEMPGLQGDALRSQWLSDVTASNSAVALSLLGDMPAWLQKKAIPGLYAQSADPAYRRQVLARIRDATPDPQQLAVLQQQLYTQMGSPESLELLRTQWQDLPAGSLERTAALAAWANKMMPMDADAISAELAALPAANRTAALEAVLKQYPTGSPAFLPLMDQALSLGQWSLLADIAERPIYGQEKARDLADWAVKLPDRPDTQALYLNLTSQLIATQPDQAAAWLDPLPHDDWHWQLGAAALYSQQLDQGVSAEMPALTDPRAQAIAEKAYAAWQATQKE